MRATQIFAVLVGLCLLGAGVAVTGAADTTSVDGEVGTTLASDHVNGCAAESPGDLVDPGGDTSDVVGWVEGYWYNEPLAIEGSTLNTTELDKLVRRTAARVEALRCLTFDGLPPTEMQTREEYRTELESQFESQVTPAAANFDNAFFSTSLIAGQSVDAVELQLEAQTSFPAAYYDIEEAFIGFITEDPENIQLDQATLAHELVHALQNQHFELASVFEQETTDDVTSSLAVVEGDATLVEERYRQNCEQGLWVDSCIQQSSTQPPEIPSWPLTLEQLAAYNTPLVEDTYESNGWAGVNSLLENRPDSIVEAIYPDRYGEFEPTVPTVEDQSNDEWERIELSGRSDDVVGQHALTAILVAPFYESNTEIISIDEFIVDPVEQVIDYGHPVTDGWQGDRFYGYTNGADTAGVWELTWNTSDEAGTFADAFEELATHRGATPAEGHENVYTFDASEEYDMALGLERDGDSILVVTAPSVDELTAVHGTFSAVPDDGGSDDGSNGGGDDGSDGGNDDGSDGGSDDGSNGGSEDGSDGGSDDGSDGGSDNGGDGGSDDGSDGGSDDGSDSGGDGGSDGGSDDGMGGDSTDNGGDSADEDGAGDGGDNTSEDGADDSGADGSGAGFGVVVVVVSAVAAGLLAARRRQRE